MKTITLDTSTPEGRAAAHAALQGRSGGSGRAKQRRAKGEGTGSRTSALNELAAAGWHRYACNDVTHTMRHDSGRVVSAGSYDALLDTLLKDVRGK